MLPGIITQTGWVVSDFGFPNISAFFSTLQNPIQNDSLYKPPNEREIGDIGAIQNLIVIALLAFRVRASLVSLVQGKAILTFAFGPAGWCGKSSVGTIWEPLCVCSQQKKSASFHCLGQSAAWGVYWSHSLQQKVEIVCFCKTNFEVAGSWNFSKPGSRVPQSWPRGKTFTAWVILESDWTDKMMAAGSNSNYLALVLSGRNLATLLLNFQQGSLI